MWALASAKQGLENNDSVRGSEGLFMATFLEQATFYGVEWGCSPGLESSPAPALLGRKTSQV